MKFLLKFNDDYNDDYNDDDDDDNELSFHFVAYFFLSVINSYQNKKKDIESFFFLFDFDFGVQNVQNIKKQDDIKIKLR